MRTPDLHWAAGIIEGEGSFGFYPIGGKAFSPRLQVGMSDLDVMERLRLILGIRAMIHRRKANQRARKAHYCMALSGKRAIGWMLTLYPLMGERRKAKIRDIIFRWRTA